MPVSKFKASVSRHYHHLMQIRDTPHAIAGGVAIGVFFGFTPLFGFKTLLAVLIAWLFRCSKISAALAVTFHDIILPLWPLVMRWQYQIGYWLWYHPHHLPKKLKYHHPTVEQLLDLNKFENVIWPMFIGSVIMAVPVSLIIYVITLKIVARYQERLLARTDGPPNPS